MITWLFYSLTHFEASNYLGSYMQKEGARVYQSTSNLWCVLVLIFSSFTLNSIMECGVKSSQVSAARWQETWRKKNSTPPQHWLISKIGVLSTWNSSGGQFFFNIYIWFPNSLHSLEQGLTAVLVNPGVLGPIKWNLDWSSMWHYEYFGGMRGAGV